MERIEREDQGRPWGWLEPLSGPPVDAFALHPDGDSLVGRAEVCAIRLPHEGVSRRHCVICRCEDGWSVTDLGSTHGTHLDGQRLAPGESRGLVDGAALGIGPWIFRVRLGRRRDEPVSIAPPERIVSRGSYATRPTLVLRPGPGDGAPRELTWQEFRCRYAPVILGFARNAGLVGDEADDVLQDVLLCFFGATPAFEYDPSNDCFRACLRRAVLDAIRKRCESCGEHAIGRVSGRMEREIGAAPESDELWEQEWAAQVMQRAIADVMSFIDRRTFEAFDLHAQRGLPAEDVAARLGTSPNSVLQATDRVVRAAQEIAERIRAEEG